MRANTSTAIMIPSVLVIVASKLARPLKQVCLCPFLGRQFSYHRNSIGN